MNMKSPLPLLAILIAGIASIASAAPVQWVTYEPKAGTANGKHVVFLSGDEEYRSEESGPQLGKLLSQRHGFKVTVLFSQDPDGTINPNNSTNVPGMHLMGSADVVINQFRFRELPDADMKHFVDYLDAGKPMIVVRTASHAFNYVKNKQSPYANFSHNAKGGGFGGMTVGHSWTTHWGAHAKESARGVIDGKNMKHPVLSSVTDVWGPSDVYGVNPTFPEDATILMYGQVLKGMKPDDAPNLSKAVMPMVWLRDYKAPSGKTAKILSTSIGAAIDLQSEDLRRLFVNGCYHLTGMTVPKKAEVDWMEDFKPSMFGFNTYKKGVKVSEHLPK